MGPRLSHNLQGHLGFSSFRDYTQNNLPSQAYKPDARQWKGELLFWKMDRTGEVKPANYMIYGGSVNAEKGRYLVALVGFTIARPGSISVLD